MGVKMLSISSHFYYTIIKKGNSKYAQVLELYKRQVNKQFEASKNVQS